ncbi:hypothetical protein MYX04_09080 [Nitrospiraceae bacterium AH_259_D15_M11_P09]|nr:hypothetical protein [Nitrospiraceae bacterium AH_259_D15_M11_P09]
MSRIGVLLAAFMAVGFFGVASVSAYQEAAVSNGGAVSGKITYKGTPPPPEHFRVEKNPEFCGAERDFYHIKVDKGALLHAIVLIEGVQKGKPLGSSVVELVGENCAFLPFTNVVPRTGKGRKGSPFMHVVNKDTVIHNPHTFEIVIDKRGMQIRRSLFNIGLPRQGSELKKKLLVRRSPIVKLQCDQHDFMHSWVRVVKNPYWTIVGKDGSYKIDQIPPGKYNLVAWHPILGEQKRAVTVGANGAISTNFTFSGTGSGR